MTKQDKKYTVYILPIYNITYIIYEVANISLINYLNMGCTLPLVMSSFYNLIPKKCLLRYNQIFYVAGITADITGAVLWAPGGAAPIYCGGLSGRILKTKAFHRVLPAGHLALMQSVIDESSSTELTFQHTATGLAIPTPLHKLCQM